MQDLLSPAIYAQSAYYRSLGLRERILNLTLMVAAVLTLIWRQVPSVQELSRMLEQQELLWGKAVKVSQQALSQRFLSFSRAVWACFSWLAATVTSTLAPKAKRPLPVAVKYAHKHFDIWIADGSTLEALFRKLESLQDAPQGKLAGKLCTVIDLLTRLPVQVWFHTNPLAHDTNFLADLLNFTCLDLVDSRPWVLRLWIFVRLIAKQVDFITRIKSMQRLKLSEFWVPTTRSETVCFKTGDKTNHCYGCASSKSAKVKQCMVTSPQC